MASPGDSDSMPGASKRVCPQGMRCAVRENPKHASLFDHFPEAGDSGADVPAAPAETLAIAGAPPGASPDAPRARRPCPSGADCQLRHIARHEELFTHAVAAAAPGDEAGAPASAPAPAPVPAAVATQSEEWTCGACTFRNAANRNSCEMCTSPKPSVDEMGPG